MSLILAATWDPRGELRRLQRCFPLLESLYDDWLFILPSWTEAEILDVLADMPLRYEVVDHWPEGRYRCLKHALAIPADTIHYVDTDRLVRWAETRPDELRRTVAQLPSADCLVIGRTAAAYSTHPRALVDTEWIVNEVFSHIVGQKLDFSAGSKAFSRAAVEYLVAHAAPDFGLGTDTEWVVLLHRAGFAIHDIRVDGLDWETADRYRDTAADPATQRAAAAAYDADAANWAMRVKVAQQMMQSGLRALRKELA